MRRLMFTLTVVAATLWLSSSDAQAFGRRGNRGGCGGGCSSGCGYGGGCRGGFGHRGRGRGCGGGCGYSGGCGGGCGYAGGCGGGCGYAGGCGGCGNGYMGGCGGWGYAAGDMNGPVYAAIQAPVQAETFVAQQAVPAMAGIRLVVNVPQGARLYIDGHATQATSAQRVFESPAVPLGKPYQYQLRAEISKDGKTYTVNRVLAVQPGQENQVTLNLPTAVVSR